MVLLQAKLFFVLIAPVISYGTQISHQTLATFSERAYIIIRFYGREIELIVEDMGWRLWWWWWCWAAVMVVVEKVGGEEVTYDGRSLIIDGQRKILFSGSIHYPRSTPQVSNLFFFCIIFLSFYGEKEYEFHYCLKWRVHVYTMIT